ncbi:hypothetical protein [Thalassobacillus hwangdonensis]|uniref:DUF4352 domain-containing protein n=1 Tax=Thalassobacillus hwangdonensis TaxID=546108 RepID=A0ABW3KZY9_9BACI
MDMDNRLKNLKESMTSTTHKSIKLDKTKLKRNVVQGKPSFNWSTYEARMKRMFRASVSMLGIAILLIFILLTGFSDTLFKQSSSNDALESHILSAYKVVPAGSVIKDSLDEKVSVDIVDAPADLHPKKHGHKLITVRMTFENKTNIAKNKYEPEAYKIVSSNGASYSNIDFKVKDSTWWREPKVVDNPRWNGIYRTVSGNVIADMTFEIPDDEQDYAFIIPEHWVTGKVVVKLTEF